MHEAELLESLGKFYRKDCIYLREASVDHLYAEGTFRIPFSHYVRENVDSRHFNAVDAVLCFNQLAFAFFHEGADFFENSGIISSERFKGCALERSLIVTMDNVKFRKIINPQKDFKGKLKILSERPRRRGLVYVLRTEYDFGEGAATGNVNLALDLR